VVNKAIHRVFREIQTTRTALEGFGHDNPLEGRDLAGPAVEFDIVWASQIAVL